jgi:hypothetical protein
MQNTKAVLTIFVGLIVQTNDKKTSSVALVFEQTIATERLQLVGEVRGNVYG